MEKYKLKKFKLKKIGIKKIIITLCIAIPISWYVYVIWDGLLSNIFPWTMTFFGNYESFDELLDDRYCGGAKLFLEELPAGSGKVKYYWHQQYGEKIAAYSVVLSDEEYAKIAANRTKAYCAEVAEEPEKLMYKAKAGEICYIEDTAWYEEEKLHFIKKVMKKPNEDNQYYFLVVVEDSPWGDECYNGVLLNDITKELIEFSAQLNKDATPYVGRLFWTYDCFRKETDETFYCQKLPESAHDTEYFVYRGQRIYKSGYRVALSEEDYALMKQERMEYYQTSLFENEYEYQTVGDRYLYSENDKQYLNSFHMEEFRIDYLDKLLTEEEKGQFYLGCSRLKEHDEHYYYMYYRYVAVLFNDETNEIIEVNYYGPRDTIVDPSEEEMSLLDIVGLILIMLVRLAIQIAVAAWIIRIVVNIVDKKIKVKPEPDFYDFLDSTDEK